MANVTNADIYNKLIDIGERLSTLEAITPVVAELNKVVVSGYNGTRPMKERMNIIEKYIDDCRDKDKDKKDDNKWFKRSVIGVIIAQSIGMVYAFLK